MRIKHHYCMEEKCGLAKFLEKYHVPYEYVELTGGTEKTYKNCVFDLYEDQEVYRKFRVRFPIASSFFNSFKSVEYSKADIERAEWLTVQNVSTKIQWEYDEKAFNEQCLYKRIFIKELCPRHIEQTGILSVTRPIKWGNRQFFSGPNSLDNIIFCSEQAKRILGDQWNGLEFWPVKKYNSSRKVEDLYQLFFIQSLPIEALSGGRLVTCKGCGRKILRIPQEIQQLKIDRKYLKSPQNVYTTGEVLTTQFCGYTTFSLLIVSQEFYQYCEKNKMNRGMIYEPIQLI